MTQINPIAIMNKPDFVDIFKNPGHSINEYRKRKYKNQYPKVNHLNYQNPGHMYDSNQPYESRNH